jgi:hypothetical protein
MTIAPSRKPHNPHMRKRMTAFNLAASETHRTRFIYIFLKNTTPRKMVFEDYRNRFIGNERWARPVSWGGRTGLPPTEEVFLKVKM